MNRNYPNVNRTIRFASTLTLLTTIVPSLCSSAAGADNITISTPDTINGTVTTIYVNNNTLNVKFRYANGFKKGGVKVQKQDGTEIGKVLADNLIQDANDPDTYEAQVDLGGDTFNNVSVTVTGAKQTGSPPNYGFTTDSKTVSGLNIRPAS